MTDNELTPIMARTENFMAGLMTVNDVAKELLLSDRRVRQFIADERLRAIQINHQYFIKRSDYLDFASKTRQAGRPKSK